MCEQKRDLQDMKHLFETSLIQIQLWKDTRMDLQSIYYIICLSHSVWMSLSLFLSLSQSLLSGNSSVCFLCLFFFFFTAFLLIYAACHENSHRTKYEKISEGGLKKSHHIQLRDFLVHSRVRENKQIAEDEGENRKVFPSQLQLFSQGGAGLDAALCK